MNVMVCYVRTYFEVSQKSTHMLPILFCFMCRIFQCRKVFMQLKYTKNEVGNTQFFMLLKKHLDKIDIGKPF